MVMQRVLFIIRHLGKDSYKLLYGDLFFETVLTYISFRLAYQLYVTFRILLLLLGDYYVVAKLHGDGIESYFNILYSKA